MCKVETVDAVNNKDNDSVTESTAPFLFNKSDDEDEIAVVPVNDEGEVP